MTAPTPLSALPFVGFTITLPDNLTNVQAPTPPFSNTKEILIANQDSTAALFFRLADTRIVQAQISVYLVTGAAAAGDVLDPVWSGGPQLTGTAGPRTPGADDFDATLTGAALRDEIIAAFNDGANSFAGTLVASVGTTVDQTANGGIVLYSVVLTVDTAIAAGAASNGLVFNAVNVGAVNFRVSPGNVTTATTQGGSGTPLASLTIDATNSTWLPAFTAITLAVGSEGERQDLGGNIGSSGLALVFRAASGNNVQANVTYVQNRGGASRFLL
jgi:hypothetical protein